MIEQNCKCGKPATRKITFDSDEGFFYCCDNPECKVKLADELYEEQFRDQYFQGKSLRNYKYSSEVLFYSIIGITAFSLCYFIWNIVNNFLK